MRITIILRITRRRHQLHITPYSRFGPFGHRSGAELEEDSERQLAAVGKHIQPDTSLHLAASRPVLWALKGCIDGAIINQARKRKESESLS